MCDVCGEAGKHLTEPRDYFYPDFSLLTAFKIAKEQNVNVVSLEMDHVLKRN